jgi:opacity protein-like surface antigen
MQWENAIIGLELNYNHIGFRGSAADSMTRVATVSSGYTYTMTVSSQATLDVQDYVTMRVRGGWAGEWFMPYMFGAVAVARVDANSTASVNSIAVDTSGQGRPDLNFSDSRTDGRNGAYAYGYAAGIGADLMLAFGLFVRAEWEYLNLTYSGGYEASINTVRGGLGYKF